MQKVFRFFVSFLLMILIFSCASVSYIEDPEKYNTDIAELKVKIKNNPNDEKTVRDLGTIYFRIADYKNAKTNLENAYKINSNDAQTILYYGLTLEFLQNTDEAIQIYKKFPNISILSPYRSKIEGRYHWLTRRKIQEQMRSLLLQETQLTEKRILPRKIAVFPFNLISGNVEYISLGRGLAEMIITDLSQVKRIELVERTRIQALLEEIALGQTGIIEEKTAPRFGKLLGAGKIIHGNFSISDQNNLNLDAAFWDIINKQFPQFTQMSENLDNLFKLEKDLVFSVINKMGIQLTMEEKQKIQLIPTKNMQAFMAYCIGLELQDTGNFEDASEQFNKALELDPNFSPAKENAQKASSTGAASGNKEQFAVATGSGPVSSKTTDQLVSERLRNLNNNVGSNFVPGEDSRKSGEEAANAGADIGITDLPDPPRPPGN